MISTRNLWPPRISPRYRLGILVLALLMATFGIVHYLSWQNSLRNLDLNNSQQLERFVGHLQTQLSRFKFLPQLIAKNTLFIEALNHPEDSAGIEKMNRFLEEINHITGASDIYLMDASGLTLAASNWRGEKPFIGQNFSFRPYFIEAMQGRTGQYFALGKMSKKRGYYFSYPVGGTTDNLGVVAIKMDLSNIEQYWSQRAPEFIVSDPDGIVFITTNPEWLYRSTKTLSDTQRNTIKRSLRYGDLDFETLEMLEPKQVSEHSFITEITTSTKKLGYLANDQDMPDAGWTVQVLSPLQELKKQSLIIALTALLLVLSSLLFILLAVQRNRRRLERERIHQEAQKQLEKKVILRTVDLQNEIDEHKQTETALRETQDELIQTAKLAVLGQMSASISHELNNPLAAIRSYTDNARKYLSLSKSEKADENLERIAGLTNRMARISSQLKFFSRKSSGNPEAVKIAPVIQTSIDLVRPQYKKLDIHIDTDAVQSNLIAQVDTLQLEQVLINLINNAINAIGTGAEGTIYISTARQADNLLINIDDTGPGINEENMARIFEPFFTTRKSGLGLGLSISSRIIESMHGKLSATNLAHGGARFIISLPAYRNIQ